MELIVAIVPDEDAGEITEALADKGYKSTRVSTASGFLKMGNTTLLIGVGSDHVEEVLGIIKSKCRPRTEPVPPSPARRPSGFPPLPSGEIKEVEVGGAVVFILEVKRFERF